MSECPVCKKEISGNSAGCVCGLVLDPMGNLSQDVRNVLKEHGGLTGNGVIELGECPKEPRPLYFSGPGGGKSHAMGHVIAQAMNSGKKDNG